jgi:hypothetical protein
VTSGSDSLSPPDELLLHSKGLLIESEIDSELLENEHPGTVAIANAGASNRDVKG